MKKIRQIKIANTVFNLDVKLTKKEFKNKYRGKLGFDLEKAWSMILEARKNK